jgi:hypothetical protein
MCLHLQRIMAADYSIPDEVHLSGSCRNLLARIFVTNPRLRITILQIKAHPWFRVNLLPEAEVRCILCLTGSISHWASAPDLVQGPECVICFTT